MKRANKLNQHHLAQTGFCLPSENPGLHYSEVIMSPRATRRGYDPKDETVFSSSTLPILLKAQEDIQWLLDHGYPMKSVITFVGSHYQLTSRQRSALQRATDRTTCYHERKSKCLDLERLEEGPLLVDGFNLIITLETAISGSMVIEGADGVIRDLAGLRGTYRIIKQTDQALDLLSLFIQAYHVPSVHVYLDAPVSNSGKLRKKILEQSLSWNSPETVDLVPNADRELSGKARIATSDSVLLDQCQSWFNLVTAIVKNRVPHPWIVQLNQSSILPRSSI